MRGLISEFVVKRELNPSRSGSTHRLSVSLLGVRTRSIHGVQQRNTEERLRTQMSLETTTIAFLWGAELRDSINECAE